MKPKLPTKKYLKEIRHSLYEDVSAAYRAFLHTVAQLKVVREWWETDEGKEFKRDMLEARMAYRRIVDAVDNRGRVKRMPKPKEPKPSDVLNVFGHIKPEPKK